ncbi:MAG: hypothetical protein JWP47_839 [Polaromonas sp.]|jgi:uncharacterized repeat protein (TIGR01451 family)|nr:hypothetical protein [Polaromonas sp.]
MYATTARRPLPMQRFFAPWLVSLLPAFLMVFAGFAAHAAPPPAGTSISNQASASYLDGTGVTRTVNSNIVQTTVQQVASLTLATSGTQNATAGSVAYYPHTLTNTGNGIDTFALSTSNAGVFSMTGVQIFADNGSGQPTGPAITSSGPVASNAQFRFIVAGTLPAGAANTNTNTITVLAASGFTPATTASNTDVTTVTSNAVITLTKSVNVSSGAPGGTYTYSLTYTNTGNSNATGVTISDPIPAGLNYVPGSARWSVTGASTPIDTGASVGTAPNTLTSAYTPGNATFAATLAQVTPGQSGIISFQVVVATDASPGIRNNTANTSYNNGAVAATGSSNTVPFNVSAIASATMTGATVAGPAAPGSTVSFTNVLTNAGTGVDTFEITLSAGNFPAGTTFQLFKSDGVTPMVDTNGNSTLDTGPIPASPGLNTYNVIVKATLPPNATNASAPFSVVKTARSSVNPAQAATATDTLTAIAASTVDLRNNSATGLGGGAGPEVAAVVTNTVAAGASTVFTLVANNTGSSPDSYNLAASTVSNFATQVPPAGWTVSFRADGGGGTCTTLGATLTNTPSVPASGSSVFCAVVTVPAGAPAGTSDLYFRTLSSTSGASDIVHDAVTVNAARSVVITNAGTGQTYPGGSFVYSHTLKNEGNVTEGSGTPSTIALSSVNNQSGWTSALYYDANNNGVLDPADPAFTGNLNTLAGLSGGLAPGASITVFNRVIAPSGAIPGAVNVTTITVTTSGGTAPPPVATITDTTTVIAGNLTLSKAQSLSTACAGPTGGTVYTLGNLSAKPNECVLYQLTVTNVGSGDATNVVVSDATPSFTTLSTAPAVTVGTITAPPAVGSAGTITATVGTLTPGQSAVVTFGVRITP